MIGLSASPFWRGIIRVGCVKFRSHADTSDSDSWHIAQFIVLCFQLIGRGTRIQSAVHNRYTLLFRNLLQMMKDNRISYGVLLCVSCRWYNVCPHAVIDYTSSVVSSFFARTSNGLKQQVSGGKDQLTNGATLSFIYTFDYCTEMTVLLCTSAVKIYQINSNSVWLAGRLVQLWNDDVVHCLLSLLPFADKQEIDFPSILTFKGEFRWHFAFQIIDRRPFRIRSVSSSKCMIRDDS